MSSRLTKCLRSLQAVTLGFVCTGPRDEIHWPDLIFTGHIIIRRPASALLDKLLCPPGPGGPAAAG